MLPVGVMRNARKHFHSMHVRLKAHLMNTFDINGVIDSVIGRYMSMYSQLPPMIKINERTVGRLDFVYKEGNADRAITLFNSGHYGVSNHTRPFPVRGDARVTIDEVGENFKIMVVEQAMNIQMLDDKIALMLNAIDTLDSHFNTLAQACHVWPCFRALIIADPRRYGITAADVPETTRLNEAQKKAIPAADIERWTLVYNDLQMRYMLLPPE